MTGFLTIENMKQLIEIMTNVIENKYKYNILSSNKLNIKDTFFIIMKKIETDEENKYLTLLQKNKLCLKIVKEIIKTKIIAPTSNSLNRDNEIHPDRKTVYNTMNTEVPSLDYNNDVTQNMELIQNTRIHQENIKEVKQLGDINKVIMDLSFDDTEFKTIINNLEQTREAFDTQLHTLFPSKDKQLPPPINESSSKLIKEDIKETLPLINKSSSYSHPDKINSFLENRNDDISIILNKNIGDIDPTSFYKETLEINNRKEIEQNVIPSSYKNLAMSTLIPKESHHSARLEKKYILINSYDRNWIVDKYRYKYKVRFSYSTNDIIKIPYYENNPTVPHTKTEKSNGIKNRFGWVDKNGQTYDAYDDSKALTTRIDSSNKFIEEGYEDIEIIVDQDASMIGTFKDIYSIQITNVTIPTDIYNHYVNSNDVSSDHNFNFNFPYILCNIDAFQDIYDGTDDSIRKSFCQLQYHELIKTPNGRGYIILKPVQNEIKIFYPNCLSNLPTINISLTKPNGELLNNNEDGQPIFNISVSQSYYLKVTTTVYYDKNAFYKGDYVKIKNFNIYQINTNISKELIDEFNIFINKNEGHVIYENGEPNENGYYNTFYIHGPGYFDKTIGRFIINEDLMDAISTFDQQLIDNDFYQVTNGISMSDSYENGYILNMSLQHTVSLTIEMYKPDAMVMVHDKI